MCKNRDIRQATKAFKKEAKQNKDAQQPLHNREKLQHDPSEGAQLEGGTAGGVPQVSRWIPGYWALKTANRRVPACDLLACDKAKTLKNNLLDAKCFMCQEGKLEFQTVAKERGWITEKW